MEESAILPRNSLTEAIAWVRSRFEAMLATGADQPASVSPPASGLQSLVKALNLSRFESETLLLCVAAALDCDIGRLCARANVDAKPFPTFALAMALFADADWRALSPHAALRHWRLLEIHQTAGEPLSWAALRADERIVNYVWGLYEIDDRVANVISPHAEREPWPKLTPSQVALGQKIADFLENAGDGDRRAVIRLAGSNRMAKLALAATLAQGRLCGLWRLAASSLVEMEREADEFARLIARETILCGAWLLIDADEEAAGDAAKVRPILSRFLSLTSSVTTFLASEEPSGESDRPSLTAEVGKPTAREQYAAWLTALGPGAEEIAGEFAGHFHLDLPEIASAVDAAGPRTDDEGWRTRLSREARTFVRPRVSGLAERIDVKAAPDDLVLPEPQTKMLAALAAQARHRWTVYQEWEFSQRMNRGLGVAALFSGPSGTGKTMAAETVANQLGLDLYRIDLASVINKYVGETEKNLRRAFDAFEDGGAVLFFDEADALFGKRSDVRDSHDRYANIEINYLLQRLESYRGLAILATNRPASLDPAFLRRLRFVIEFPLPDAGLREQIWARAFPSAALGEPLDLPRLARLSLTGGNIHAIALNAAFAAAAQGRKVEMTGVLACARAEMVKLDLPLSEADFRAAPDLRRRA